MKFSAAILAFATAAELKHGGAAGKGITDHADGMYNQLTAAPTPVPGTAAERYALLKSKKVGGPTILKDKKYTTTDGRIPGACYTSNQFSDQIEYVQLTGVTSTTVSGTVGYKPVHSGGWTMSSGVSVQCWHYAGAWDSTPILDKQDAGIGYGYGYGNGPARTHKFTYTVQNDDVEQHFIRCGIIDRASRYCKFDSNTHCATSSAGSSGGHHYDNADAPFVMTSSAEDVRGMLDAQIAQSDRVAAPTAQPTAFPTKDRSTVFGSDCNYNKDGISFTKPVGWVGAGPEQYYCNVWKCEPGTDSFKESSFKKSKRTCSVEEYGNKFCSHTTCKRVQTDEELKKATLAIYTFDTVNGKQAFVNHINDKNFQTTSTTFKSSSDWNWSSWYWGSFTNRYHTTYLYSSGSCKIERYNGNMAWHVNNNAGASGFSPCSITTSSKMQLESYWDQCKFSLKVTDVDHEYARKESNDKICFQVLDDQKRTVLDNEVCQQDDVRRLVDYTYQGSSSTTRSNGSARCGVYGCIGWYGYGTDETTTYRYTMKSSNYGISARSKIIESDWIPTSNFANGFYVKISAVTNDINEHWYADDLKIECREMRSVISVTSDHRETVGGKHICGYSQHTDARTAGRPACDCVCKDARRQDAAGFERSLSQISKDFSISNREAVNSNSFHSQHTNLDYNENDQSYRGQKIAHAHRDSR